MAAVATGRATVTETIAVEATPAARLDDVSRLELALQPVAALRAEALPRCRVARDVDNE